MPLQVLRRHSLPTQAGRLSALSQLTPLRPATNELAHQTSALEGRASSRPSAVPLVFFIQDKSRHLEESQAELSSGARLTGHLRASDFYAATLPGRHASGNAQ